MIWFTNKLLDFHSEGTRIESLIEMFQGFLFSLQANVEIIPELSHVHFKIIFNLSLIYHFLL
jgi:hypothetical protein